ncbi:MAG TPA: winged helix-turn-helix domain-containing protein [Bryobacterales bacterium]|jgi:DNA-binding response OmpR family regulator|nr:winged helix-turn-helix domain-containing protein [Bryobacterales bacterium]
MFLKEEKTTRDATYQDPHLIIHFQRQRVELDGATLTLTRKEYDLLAMLSQNAGEIVPRDVLLRQVWGYCEGIRTRTLDVHIRRLRKKLEPFSDRYIETIFGIGYRFQPFRPRTAPYEMQKRMAVSAIA